jgi:hypothetical protein
MKRFGGLKLLLDLVLGVYLFIVGGHLIWVSDWGTQEYAVGWILFVVAGAVLNDKL